MYTKNKHDKSEVSLNIQGKIEQNQRVVAKYFASYFSTIANHIGDPDERNLTEADFEHHDEIKLISDRWVPNIFNFYRRYETSMLKKPQATISYLLKY